MCAVVVASNVLVQYPVHLLGLQDLLTWGAFTYPLAFLATDLTNRRFGPAAARRVVYVGFALAVLLSIWLATPRIAIASGTAFLVAQMLDVGIFHRLRAGAWWRAPLVSSIIGSLVDTALFFSLAFAAMPGAFWPLNVADGFATEYAPLLGFAMEAPRWMSWALGDLAVKVLTVTAALLPYRFLAIGNGAPEPA
ncbi:MAG: queuosine precursor transporter [Pseudomonadota bacterium]